MDSLSKFLYGSGLGDLDMGGFKPTVSYPGDNCCYLYDQIDFGHTTSRDQGADVDERRRKICHDGHRAEIDMASIDWNEKTASYVCGKNVWFDFCQNGAGSDCTGRHGGNSGAGHIKNHRIRYQLDPVRSAVLGPYDPTRAGAATIFEGNECTGPSARFYWNPKSQANGTYYSRDDMLFGGLHDGTANSIMVPKGYIVELYDSSGFYEPKKVVKGAFKDSSQEMVCQRIQPDIDDKLSSIIVKK